MPYKKYRFKKMYLICTDNIIISENVWATNIWQHRDKAQEIADQMAKSRGMHIINEIPMEHKVHGFFLVHESLYELILKEWNKENEK